MTVAVADTTVVIHIFRKNSAARAWFAAQPDKLSITPITWLEIMYGARGKSGQTACKTLLDQFEIVYLTQTDQDWAMAQMLKYRLSHGIEINDCLIASVCHRLQVPIYTHNVKDMAKFLSNALVLKPKKPFGKFKEKPVFELNAWA
jgi:predicted nucleic acid-binding protein